MILPKTKTKTKAKYIHMIIHHKNKTSCSHIHSNTTTKSKGKKRWRSLLLSVGLWHAPLYCLEQTTLIMSIYFVFCLFIPQPKGSNKEDKEDGACSYPMGTKFLNLSNKMSIKFLLSNKSVYIYIYIYLSIPDKL